MADGDQNIVYVLNGENRFALFPGIGLTSNGGAYDGSVERYFDVDTSLFLSLSGEQIIDGQKTFTLNPIIGTAEPVLTTGNQTVAGIKTFTNRPFVNGVGVVLSGDAAGVATPNNLTFGFGIQSSGDFFNGSAAKTIAINPNEIVSITGIQQINGQKTFTLTPKVGSGTVILNTGEQTLSGKLIINNEFIQSGSLNIGGTGSGNFFGTSAILNSFGNSGQANNFGGFSILNSFGANTPTNEFGKLSVNKFGEGGINTFYSGIFTGQTIFQNNIMVGGGKPVMNTGVEIIGGLKTFSNDLVVEGDLILGHGNTIIYSNVDTIIGGSGNSLSGDASVILGGVNNILNGSNSFIGVGVGNKVSGVDSSILNGILNTITGNDNTIINGSGNRITSGFFSLIGNGFQNEIYDSNSFIANGEYNKIYKANIPSYLPQNGTFSFIGGGFSNKISGAQHSFIGAGETNQVNNSYSFLGAGTSNKINGYYSFVGAGGGNEANGPLTFIGTAAGSKIYGELSAIVNGESNTINDNYSFIGAGENNIISKDYSVIVGGVNNEISGQYGFIGGGRTNKIIGLSEASTIVGGRRNLIAQNSTNGFIGGGTDNTVSGTYSSILAGQENKIYSSYSNAIGRRIIINSGHLGATVISDGEERFHYSRGGHTLSLDFFNGVYFKLPQFTGLSSQTGNRGEMAMSGDYLYVCTGTAGSGWGRIQLNSF
jgi:hypothetical protein